MRGINIAFRDLTLILFLTMAAVVILMLPHLNPPTKAADRPPDCNVQVDIAWPDDKPADIDLWVLAPRDRPVGYSNKAGAYFNLLRDDLGLTNDLTDRNGETACTRGIPDGEYVVNLHYYGKARWAPVPVQVTVSVRVDPLGASRVLLTGEAIMAKVGQEITVLRFTLLAGQVVHRSPLPMRLRAS